MEESPTMDVNVVSTDQLISPAELARQIPVSPAAERTVIEGREQIRRVLQREDDRMMMVVGAVLDPRREGGGRVRREGYWSFASTSRTAC